MPYILGVDLGTGATTAAVSRLRRGAWGDVEVVGATGGADRGVPGLLSRVGDDVPLVLDDEPYRAPALTAELAAWVVDQVVAEEGEPAEQVAFVVPASWGPYRRGLVHEALWRLGLDGVLLLAEPVAAAEAYAAGHPVDVGATVAVYSLGESAATCSVVRRISPSAFEVLDSTELAEGAGVADLGDLVDGADLARADVEELIRPVLEFTVAALARTVRAAGVGLDALLLVGEAGRIPLARRLVEAAVPARVLTDVDPLAGAVHAARTRLARPDEVALPETEEQRLVPGDEPLPRPPRPPVVVTPLESPRSRARRRR
jgi:molecular chaperone DnaK